MSIGVSAPHTSVPHPTTLAPDRTGRAHLVVAAPGDPAAARLVQALRTDVVEVLSPDDVAVLETELRGRLASAVVGLRLYVAGSEGLVRRIVALALGAGLEPDEIRTEVTASQARSVWCTHCKAVTPDVATSHVACAGCGRTLEVYHHFSRRRGAYMGFQADAEQPGDLPEPETRWA